MACSPVPLPGCQAAAADVDSHVLLGGAAAAGAAAWRARLPGTRMSGHGTVLSFRAEAGGAFLSRSSTSTSRLDGQPQVREATLAHAGSGAAGIARRLIATAVNR